MNLLFRIIFLFILFTTAAFPQIKVHKKLGVEDGLIQSTIRTIFKDSDGRLWFGTNLGVSCWDGIDFKNFSTANGLPGHTVFSICEDKNKNIYFGTSNGASLFKNNKFSNLKTEGKSAGRIKDIEISEKGNVYFTSDKDLYVLDKDHLKIKTFNNQLSGVQVTSVAKSRSGKIFLSTKGNGYFTIESDTLKTGIETEKDVNSIFIRENNDIALVSGSKIYLLNETGISSVVDLQKYESINTISEDNNGVLFIGTNKGVVLWKNQIIDEINTQNGLINNKVYSIYKDEDGSMYIGLNSGGVAIINRYRIQLFNEENGLINNNVTSICQGNGGEYYFGTREHGVSIFKNGKFTKMDALEHLKCTQIICIAKMKNGDIYFGTNGGVVVLGKEKLFTITREQGLESNIITAINENSEGKIAIGTVRGLSIFSGGKFTNYSKKNGLGDNLVTSICSEKDVFYIGTFFNGVTKINNGKLSVINKDKGLISNTVYSLSSCSHKLYIGTIEGLNIIEGNSIKLLNTKTGLSDNSINSIISDNCGTIYAATNRGINVMFPEGDKYKIKVLLSEDGISGEECNMGAVYKENSGKLWFGTIKGVISFDPRKITPGYNPPAITLRNIYLFDEEVNIDKVNNYSYDQNFFRFVYFGVLLSAPKRVVYSYRMKGLNENWTQTTQSSVQFTNLDPGDYQFEVMAKNEWGFWSKPVSYSFVIKPPLWQRWWFIILTIIIVGGLLVLGIVKHVRSLLNVERLRLKIAAELHDNIGASLTEISIMSEVAKRKMCADTDKEEAVKYLDLISNECRNLISGMKDIVWMVNPKKDTLKDLIIRLNDCFAEIFNQKGISFRAENIELLHRISLPMDYRHNLYLILKEGINNSLKYSQCDELCLKARMKGNNLELILKDNGIGILSPSEGNGLFNMKDRAKKIGGDLHIYSDEHQGTEIRFVGRVV